MNPPNPKKKSRLRRWLRGVAYCLVAYGVSLLAGCSLTGPFDLVTNIGPVDLHDDLRASADRPTLVVLQHGISRSSWSLWRLERTLEAHGYEVFNPSYASTQEVIEKHAEKLGRGLEKHLAAREGPEPRICFVGHSMGGLVIRSYLSQPRARPADACVFISVPHRGAVLAGIRQDLWAFRLFLGGKAAAQLRLGDPFYATLPRVPCRDVGCIYGASGEADGGNDAIRGDDDGTVGVAEAQLPEQSDAVALPVGHTRIAWYDGTMRQVLYFLRHRTFER